MAKKKKKIVYKGHALDSKEELRVFLWLEDAKADGFVSKFTPHKDTYILCEPELVTKVKYKFLKRKPFIDLAERTVNKVGGIVYTPDFEVVFTKKMIKYYPDTFTVKPGAPLLIDVKGGFNGGRNNSSGLTFPIKAAWLFFTQGLFVQKVKPNDLFKATWVPDECRYTPVKRDLTKEYLKPGYKTRKEAAKYRDEIDALLKQRKDSGYKALQSGGIKYE